MGKKKKVKKPRNLELHEILANVKPGKHKTGKKDDGKRRKNKERLEVSEGLY